MGRRRHLHEPLLVGIVTSDHLGQCVNRLCQDISRDARGKEDLGELGHHSAGERGLLARCGHLTGVGRRVESAHQLQNVKHVCHLLCIPTKIVCLDYLKSRPYPVYVAAFLEKCLIAWVVSEKVQ